MTEIDLLGRLSQIRMNANGKVPFGPIDDLHHLKTECDIDESSKRLFQEAIDQRKHDDFWKDFIRLAFTES